MAGLGHTIAVFDKSGKVVSTSKHLFGVFSEAKAAYRERKSQLNTERNAKIAEQQALRGPATLQIDDAHSVAGSRRSHGAVSRHQSTRRLRGDDAQSTISRSRSHGGSEVHRRHTQREVAVRPKPTHSQSDAHIDMDLAYGEAHPDALLKYEENGDNQKQLDGLVGRAQWLLQEAKCVQHGATATIAHLQKNPEAMAAVALTLAEISKIASKMAPSALMSFKTAAPAIFALLSSPQFLIAAGVGIGATVVMFGGYKIIKKIKGDSGDAPEIQARQFEPSDMEELMELNVGSGSLSRVEMWRRGVADIEANSIGTSVEGEFITERAAALSGIDVTTARLERDPRFKFDDDSVASSRRSRRSRAHGNSHAPSTKAPSTKGSRFFSKSKAPSEAPTKSHRDTTRSRGRSHSRAPSEAPSRASSRSKTDTHVTEKERRPRDRPKEKKKGPSLLRLMFTAA
ncbi:hypothetical protein N7495_003164 [Penicillium taxi]|uniref:uncharacterized protein n=1 Tax=Penicillium taxi TaxID=168475 RepID=UPI0025455A78|nr:uncharacterized protein N7495_003164 [Penicillium taxi]KAJ5902636.1 hypothetical protein N7495_003164 [Penicillium taxi]